MLALHMTNLDWIIDTTQGPSSPTRSPEQKLTTTKSNSRYFRELLEESTIAQLCLGSDFPSDP